MGFLQALWSETGSWATETATLIKQNSACGTLNSASPAHRVCPCKTFERFTLESLQCNQKPLYAALSLCSVALTPRAVHLGLQPGKKFPSPPTSLHPITTVNASSPPLKIGPRLKILHVSFTHRQGWICLFRQTKDLRTCPERMWCLKHSHFVVVVF